MREFETEEEALKRVGSVLLSHLAPRSAWQTRELLGDVIRAARFPVNLYIETSGDLLEWVEELLRWHLTAELAPIREELAKAMSGPLFQAAAEDISDELVELLIPVIERACKRALEQV